MFSVCGIFCVYSCFMPACTRVGGKSLISQKKKENSGTSGGCASQPQLLYACLEEENPMGLAAWQHFCFCALLPLLLCKLGQAGHVCGVWQHGISLM